MCKAFDDAWAEIGHHFADRLGSGLVTVKVPGVA
jgi:hypothetical protein